MFFTNSLLGDLVSFFLTFSFLIFFYFKWSYHYWRRRNVPYLDPEIPFGNVGNAFRGKEFMAICIKNIHDEMRRRGWKHGGLYVLSKPHYMPIDLDLIKNILTKDFYYFNMRDGYINEKQPLQAHLLRLGGAKWKNLRDKLSPVFTSGKMKLMFTIMAECQKDLLRRMEKECVKKEPINIKEILACFTTNIIGACAFGLEFQALEDENSMFRKFGQRLFTGSKFSLVRRIFIMTFPGVARALNLPEVPKRVSDFITGMVQSTIRYREKNNYTRNDFMQLMIDLKNNPPKNSSDHDGKPLTLNEIASQAFVFFVAGFETSSNLMTFALYQLAKHQDIQDEVRREIDTVLAKHDDKMTYEAVQEMKYLTQVIDETLRLHPPMPILRRKCTKDYEVPGEDVVIEEGTVVTISMLGVHLDERYYPEPEKFDPDRFSDENKKLRPQYAFLPFGEGPRICIGMRFGLLQAKVGLVSLLKNYKFTVSFKTQQPLTYKPNAVFLTAQGEIWLDAQKIDVE